jgi:flagellar hook-associated protein 2
MSTSSSSISSVGTVASDTIAQSLASSTGLNSGMDISGIISKLIAVDQQPIDDMQTQVQSIQQQEQAYTAIQTKASTLLTSIEALTTRNFDGTTIFDQMATTSSNTAIATATTGSGAAPQTINLEVDSLPTQTKAASTGLVGKFDTTASLSELGVSSGTFTIYVNNQAKQITVDATKTVGDVFNDISSQTGGVVTPSIVNGKVNLAYSGGSSTSIQLGSGGDTSNFLSKMHLDTANDDGSGNITASLGTTTFSTSTTLSSSTDLNTPVTDGTFSINGVSFDTTGKSLSTVLTEINSSSANVVANFNSTTNKLELSSKNTGRTYISLANGTGNFLTAMGLVNGSDSTTSQTLGTNAKFVLNGTTMYSPTTTVNQNVTGLTGITLNLNSASVGTTTQIGVALDTTTISNDVSAVVTSYNAVISAIDTQTDSTSTTSLLKGDSNLENLRNSLRELMTSAVSGLSNSSYTSLQDMGITTGAVGTGAVSKGSPTLQFDSSKLTAALASDPLTVKKLFIGQDLTGAQNGGLGDDNMQGTLTLVQHLLSDQKFTDGGGGYGALYAGTGDTNQGLFASYQTSAQNRIQALNDSISQATDRLNQKQTLLEQQYQNMDTLIGQYQQQGSAVTSMIKSLSSS